MQGAAAWHVRKVWRAWLTLAVNQGRQRRATASATAHACLLTSEQRLQQVSLQVREGPSCVGLGACAWLAVLCVLAGESHAGKLTPCSRTSLLLSHQVPAQAKPTTTNLQV